MFSTSLRKKLIEQFSKPTRYHEFQQLAELVIEDTRYKSVQNFLHALEEEEIVRAYTFEARNGKTVSLYCSYSLKDLSTYDVARAMFPDGYFCNMTSIYYHSLTKQIPKSVYICQETISSRKRSISEKLSDTRLRNAFIKPHRYTNYVFDFKSYEVVAIDRVKDSRHGVEEVRRRGTACPHGSRVTCVERALIDAVVAPHYNGGVASLSTFFRAARHKLKIEKLLELYSKLDFVYPYVQSIGFFLEKSGMQVQASKVHHKFPPRRQFYVDHNAKSSWVYDDRWMLFYPKGLVDES